MNNAEIPRWSKLLYQIFFPLLILLSIVVGYAVYLATWHFPTIAIVEPITISNDPIQAGSVVEYEIDQCRETDSVARIVRRLESVEQPEIYISLESLQTREPVGCYIYSPPSIFIPDDTPTGKYRVQFDYNFDINPLQTLRKVVYSEVFQIVNNNHINQ